MILWFILSLVLLSLIVYVMQIVALRKKLNEKYTPAHTFPPISIIKPLKDLDDNLFDNLESFCKQDYPEYEIIISLQDYNDLAYKVAEKIRSKYPHLVKIVVDDSYKALNPKVKNMYSAYRISKYEYFLISDSNVYVESDYLKRTVSAMTPETGLVTNLIMGVGGKSFGAKLENLHLNSFILVSVCFLDKFLKIPCSIGKSMLMRKSDFEAIGGFGVIKDVLAEDYMIGELIHKMGKKVILCNYIIKNVNEYWSLKRFLNRHTRWAKIRWKIAGIKYFTEPLNNPIFLSSLLTIFDGFSRTSIFTFLLIVLIKTVFDLHISRMIKASTKFSGILIPIKDLIAILIWFIPLVSSKINWRGNIYKISRNTTIIPIEKNTIKLIYSKLKTVFIN
ncbi:MAG: ceramide glucosyltransferase [Thermodesulfovibrionaceae bacterium]